MAYVCVCARGGEGGFRRRRHFSPFIGLVFVFGGFSGVFLAAAEGAGRRRLAFLFDACILKMSFDLRTCRLM